MQMEGELSFNIFCAALVFFLALLFCSIGYRVCKAIALPGSEAETASQEDGSSRKTAVPIYRSNAIRDNPFHDFVRA